MEVRTMFSEFKKKKERKFEITSPESRAKKNFQLLGTVLNHSNHNFELVIMAVSKPIKELRKGNNFFPLERSPESNIRF